MLLSVPNMGYIIRDYPLCEMGMVSIVSIVFLSVQIAILAAQSPSNAKKKVQPSGAGTTVVQSSVE